MRRKKKVVICTLGIVFVQFGDELGEVDNLVSSELERRTMSRFLRLPRKSTTRSAFSLLPERTVSVFPASPPTLATAAITQGGVLWTFGQGDSNQLGHGDTGDCSNQVLPREVEDAFDGLSVVNCSICDGHMAAVTEDGSVWTWGRGTFGRLGHEYIVFASCLTSLASTKPEFQKKSLDWTACVSCRWRADTCTPSP